jgi:hypothetical protein
MVTTKAREKMKRDPNATNEPLIERYDPTINVHCGSGVILHLYISARLYVRNDSTKSTEVNSTLLPLAVDRARLLRPSHEH